jgi:hypothetical protein
MGSRQRWDRAQYRNPLALAGFTALGFIPELFIVKE